MPGKLFGVDLRLPHHTSSHHSHHKDKHSSTTTTTTTTSPATSRRPSLANMDHLKRASLTGLGKSKDRSSKDRSDSKDKHRKESSKATSSHNASPLYKEPVKLSLLMESPPALFIGPAATSTGVLLSGRLQVTPLLPDATLSSITMFLECTTTTKRPVADRCRECQTQVADLYAWHFLSKPTAFPLAAATQELPFSHLIPGHLPTTTAAHLGSISYSLHVRATTSDNHSLEARLPLPVRRALLPSADKNSVRIFPPTNLTLHVTLPSIIHPIGEFPVSCRMTGITSRKEGSDSQVRWRLRKLIWRIEESESIISPACPKHAAKLGGEGKGLQHENTREIGMDELKNGWKTDFSEGEVQGEFMAAIDSNAKPQCDVASANGLKVSHNLILELVIAEEWSTSKKPQQATPTGAARVLRTQFNLNLTDRAGMGLSWVDEQPPMYEDVPASPPPFPQEEMAALQVQQVPQQIQEQAQAQQQVPPPDSPPHYQTVHTTVMDYDGDDLGDEVEGLSLGS